MKSLFMMMKVRVLTNNCLATQNRYLIHKKRNILLIDTLWIKIMKDYNVPVYNHGKVHFKDVWKKLIKNASDEQKLDDVLSNLI